MLDADGFLTIMDRKKDMIISGGFNVFPADIEGIVGGHPAVRDVTVIGVPHEKWGEVPLALVIPVPGTAPAEVDAIRTWSNERLAKHQRLAGVEFREDFPEERARQGAEAPPARALLGQAGGLSRPIDLTRRAARRRRGRPAAPSPPHTTRRAPAAPRSDPA